MTTIRARLSSWLERRRKARELVRLNERMERWVDRASDPEENAESQPPSDESINLWFLWVVEFYGPSESKNLIDGLERLRWNKTSFGGQRSIIDFLKESRHRGRGSVMRFNHIVGPGQRALMPDSPRAELPRGVEWANGTMLQVLPSVTAFAIQFVFDEATTSCFQEILQQTHRTEHRPLPGNRGYSIISPLFRKRDDLAAARASLRSRCQYWFNKHLPGVFSRSTSKTWFPACEYVSLKKALPLVDTQGRNLYLELLGLDSAWDAWKCEQIPALRLGWRGFQQSNYLMLTANEGELAEWKKAHPHDMVTPREFGLSVLEFEPWFIAWSLSALLVQHSRSVLMLRDEALRDAEVRWFSRALRQTQRELLGLRPDVVSFAEDMNSGQEITWILRDAEYQFSSLEPRGTNKELLQLVLKSVQEEAKQLDQNMRTATDDFTTSVNLRHQSALTWYTAAIFGFTIVLVILTVVLIVLELLRDHP